MNTNFGENQTMQLNASVVPTASTCRFCNHPTHRVFLDLGMSPLCQNRIFPDQINHMESFYPLRVLLCENCFLVQLQEYVAPADIFSDYGYFSSYSSSWVEHAERYVEMVIERFSLNGESRVIELASNDGYLLQHFVKRKVPCLGIEPADNVAEEARRKGIPTISKFFGPEVALEVSDQHGKADLIVGNNVLAHVPDLNGFVGGMKILLAESGVITMEFPHLERLMSENQFDTIYHEHFSYFSFFVVEKIFAHHGLRIFDVQELPTHGGSLRIFACHDEGASHATTTAVTALRVREESNGFSHVALYESFADKVKATKRHILSFLIEKNDQGKQVVGYGAPGKGNTLLNYCGIREDFLKYTVDLSPHKQNTYTPGTHIPVYSPEKIRETKPDFVFILPWNLKNEIMAQNQYIKDWGGQFVVPIPEIQVY